MFGARFIFCKDAIQYILRLRCFHWNVHILILEDEQKLAKLLKKGLEEENHTVSLAYKGREANELIQSVEYDVIVLDLVLHEIDGAEVVRRLRKSGNKTPILILTARDSTEDVINGLDLGADDYMTKPFAFGEFLARLRSISRRGSVSRSALLQVGDLILDPATHVVTRDGTEIHLNRTEFRLLEFLMRRAGLAVTRHEILLSVWGFDAGQKTVLNVMINSLRKKVDRDHKLKLIHTIRGTGYAIRGPERRC